MSACADASVGWAVALSDEFDEDDLECSLTEMISKACGFTEPSPGLEDQAAWAKWHKRYKAAVVISDCYWGDACGGETGTLLVIGEPFRVSYAFDELPLVHYSPSEEDKDKMRAVLRALGEEESDPKLMMWVAYG